MKKVLVSSFMFLTVLSTPCLAGNVETNDIVDNAVTTPKIADGAISSQKVADGAITDSKISGLISASKISSSDLNADTVDGKHAVDFANRLHEHLISEISGLDNALSTKSDLNHDHNGQYAEKFENVITVAKSGGDFVSIQQAIDSIAQGSTERTLVQIMPGIYEENVTIYNKSNFVIKGQGNNSTIIIGTGTKGFDISYCKNFIVEGIEINLPVVDGYRGFNIIFSEDFSLLGNRVVGTEDSGVSSWSMGIYLGGVSNGTIKDNVFIYVNKSIYSDAQGIFDITYNSMTGVNSYFNHSSGIECYNGIYNISNNKIKNMYQRGVLLCAPATANLMNNYISNVAYGIYAFQSKIIAKGNWITDSSHGIWCQGTQGSMVTHNNIERCMNGLRIIDGDKSIFSSNIVTEKNGIYEDVYISTDSTPVLNLNTFNNYTGPAKGSFNVDSSGNAVVFP